MCIIVLCEKVLWQEFLAYYQLNWRNFGIWQIQRFHRFKDATTWVKLWWWPWLQEVMELQTWREAWWPWHQEVIMELQRQREAGLQLYIVNTLLLLLQPLLHPPSNLLLPLCKLPSEFSVLLLLLSPSLHFDTSVALAWIIWLQSWVHRWLIRTYCIFISDCSFICDLMQCNPVFCRDWSNWFVSDLIHYITVCCRDWFKWFELCQALPICVQRSSRISVTGMKLVFFVFIF